MDSTTGAMYDRIMVQYETANTIIGEQHCANALRILDNGDFMIIGNSVILEDTSDYQSRKIIQEAYDMEIRVHLLTLGN
jgi:hypothetical protein